MKLIYIILPHNSKKTTSKTLSLPTATPKQATSSFLIRTANLTDQTLLITSEPDYTTITNLTNISQFKLVSQYLPSLIPDFDQPFGDFVILS